MNETSRNQGWAITAGAILLGLLFFAGILQESYWAIALPVAVLVFFVLGLVAWVGHTIATIQVEPDDASPAVRPAPPPAKADAERAAPVESSPSSSS